MSAASKGCVRFAPEDSASPNQLASATAAAAAAGTEPHRLEVRLGYLPQGGIYTTDLPLEPATAAIAAGAAADPQPQQPEVRGLSAPNLSVSAEGSPHARLVLRLWADREGPFESAFTLVLPPHGQQVEVHVSATVLSRQKGKPALRPHVHCVGQATDTDTEAASDWAGF